MTRLSVDTNILIYAVNPSDTERHAAASHLLRNFAKHGFVLTQQVIGEFLNVSRRLPAVSSAEALDWAKSLLAVRPVLPTLPEQLFAAAERADRVRLQFWDSLIVTVCIANHVTHLLSEDLQDGQQIDGLTVVNPFVVANQAKLARLLPESIS